MSESLRKELAGTGVKVTNVLPGVIVIISFIITINSITIPTVFIATIFITSIFITTIIIANIIMVKTMLSQGC